MHWPKYIANSLSGSRILIGGLIFLYPKMHQNTLVICFVLALLSDFFDGMVARMGQSPSSLGKMIDPFCDAIFLILVSLSACLHHHMPFWFLYVVLSRYAIIGSISAHMMKKHHITLGSNLSGKITIISNFMTPALFIGGSTEWGWLFLHTSLLLMGMSLLAYLRDLYLIDTQTIKTSNRPSALNPLPTD